MKAALVTVLVLAAAAAGYLAGSAGTPAPPGETPVPNFGLAPAEKAALQATHDAALARVRKDLEAAETRAAEAEVKVAALRKEVEETRAAAPAEPAAAEPAKKSSGPRFALGEYEPVLKELEWEEIGTSMNTMVPLLKDLVEKARKGEKVDPRALARISKLNAPLIQAALEIGDRIPGSGVNAKFTHPAFAANSLAATLAAAGLPLSDTQAEALGKLAQDSTDRDRARTAGYAEDAWELQKVIDEADLRDAFFDGAFALFTPQQREAVSPEASRGYIGLDLFSSGLLWQQHLLPVFAPDKAGAARAVQAQAVSFLGIPEEKRGDLLPLTQEWVDGIPTTWLDGTEKLFGQPLFKSSHIEECAKVQLAVLRKIAENPAFGDGTAARARKVGSVVFPVKL